jgi:endo-1,4-beta-xylanase
LAVTWNTNRSASTGAINVTYNGPITAGQSTEFGFQATITLTAICTAS